jgi:predicted HicB family RNase H-like nuclease
MLNHKGYVGVAVFDDEAGIFHGDVINTHDVITFEGDCVKDLQQAFIDSVEDYLDFCASRNVKPEKPYSGKFVVRLDPELHQRATIVAARKGISLNRWVVEAIEEKVLG